MRQVDCDGIPSGAKAQPMIDGACGTTKVVPCYKAGPMRMMKRISPIGCALICALMIAAPLTAQRIERPALAVSGYVIDAEIDTATHHLAAKAAVTFTAPQDAESVS